MPNELIVGNFGKGAYGPTIMLKLLSTQSVQWLMGVLTSLANDASQEVDLLSRPEIQVTGLASLKLQVVEKTGEIALKNMAGRTGVPRFEWQLDQRDWSIRAELLEPLLKGDAGHQYLTEEQKDEALVVASLNEPDVRLPGIKLD